MTYSQKCFKTTYKKKKKKKKSLFFSSVTKANTSNQPMRILNYAASNISSGWQQPEAMELAIHLSPTKCSVELHFCWSSHPQTPVWSLFSLLKHLCVWCLFFFWLVGFWFLFFCFNLSWKIHREINIIDCCGYLHRLRRNTNVSHWCCFTFTCSNLF